MQILWVDDEIAMLKAHVILLQNKGYEVKCCTNGYDALEMLNNGERFDLIFLDENMPGMTGLDILPQIKQICPDVPVVMVTKSEEECIMEQAIGSKIADYLVKPVNPTQLLICLKKNIDGARLVQQTTQTAYQQEFTKLSMQMQDCRTFNDWANLYSKLVYWELELQNQKTLDDIQLLQKRDANNSFAKFIRKNYLDWIANPSEAPLMSDKVLSRRILPLLDKGEKIVLIVIDNCRLDQWETFRAMLAPDFNITTELYCSILPTTTQFARNALFSGLMPSQIKEMYPDYWCDDDNENGQNHFENQLIGTFFERYRRRDFTYGYYKVNDAESGSRLVNIYSRYKQNNLNAFVYNFVDMLSHARTDIKMVKELSTDAAAYRSITKSWFEHSPLFDMLKILKEQNVKVLITTDHGSIRVANPVKILGDREVNTNLRYKIGKNLSFNDKNIFAISNIEAAKLPRHNLSSLYVFTQNDDFFVYPNNYNHFVAQYTDTFQHGGISMEEMIIPLATLTPR